MNAGPFGGGRMGPANQDGSTSAASETSPLMGPVFEVNMIQSASPARPGAKVFGFPIDGFGLLTSFLLALATGFFTFFATTFLAIFGLLVWNGILGHNVDYADTYRDVGLPAGVVVLAIALVVFGSLWLRAKIKMK
jgi:hypothetical protein